MKSTTRGLVALSAASLLSIGLAHPVATAATSASRSTVATNRHLVDVPAESLLRRAVDPSECGSTLLDDYFDAQLDAIPNEEFAFLVAHQDTLLSVPTYDALFFGTSGDPDFALTRHAQQVRATFRDLKNFWSPVKSDDIQLMAMHGDSLLDASRITRTLTAMAAAGVTGPTSAAAIAAEAKTVADFMATHGNFYDNPLWTLNAFAFSGAGDPDPVVAALPDKLVVGDGILDAYDTIGLGDVGPRVIMAHEFGHHVQYELGTFNSGPSDPAEATRRTELMADALATYFGVHKKGLALNRKRVIDALLSFYTVGDCAFDNPGHHGTPLQRQRAAAWGADLAAAAKPQSYVLPAATVISRFDAALPSIVSGS